MISLAEEARMRLSGEWNARCDGRKVFVGSQLVGEVRGIPFGSIELTSGNLRIVVPCPKGTIDAAVLRELLARVERERRRLVEP